MGRLTLHGTNRKRFATCSWNEEFSLALSTDGASKGGSLEWTQFAPYSGGRATEISATDACALGPCQWFSLRGVSKTISPAPIRRMADSGNRPLGFHVRFGSKADICGAKWHVRFAPKSGHLQCTNYVRFVPIADIVLLKRADPMTTLFHQPSNGSHCRRRRAEEAKATPANSA